MEVIIKPHHLKGNSWVHMQNPDRRMCPLHEALEEIKESVKYVGSNYISFQLPDTDELVMFREIDPCTWNQQIADRAIKNADKGSQEEIIVKYN